MKKIFLTTLALWLTIAVTGAWAGESQASLSTADVDSIADEVQLLDSTAVNTQRLPKRAPSEDYVYKYKGVKYTYITVNNYTRFFNTSVHKPGDYGWSLNNSGW